MYLRNLRTNALYAIRDHLQSCEFFGLFRSKRGFAVTFTFSRGRIVGKEIFVEGNLLTYAKKQNFTGR